MKKADKAMVVLRQVFGWIWTALLAVEGWFAWIYVNAGISLMVEDLPDKTGNCYLILSGLCIFYFRCLSWCLRHGWAKGLPAFLPESTLPLRLR